MFHTFHSSARLRSPGADTDISGKPSRPLGSRRISTSNACVECRRRKIRCDGTQPCGQCQWYQHPEACGYLKPAQRIVPSRKLVDKLSNSIEQYKTVLNKLYGSKDLKTLASLPREELLEMALSSPAPVQMISPSGIEGCATSESRTVSDGADSLEQAPPEDPFWDEARKHQICVQGICDDVNGLSMSVDRTSSYVGISSVIAALKVIVRCAPHVWPLITQQNTEIAMPSRASSPPLELTDNSPLVLPSSIHGQELLESYFDCVHPFFPLIDERKFWSTYLYGNRKDSQWLCLLNMVFALGSLASSSTDNEAHYIYFGRSRQHLSLESFGSGNLEVLQALAIMSGFYMHYLNRPNEAHSLMGGALRMATALGLHREYLERTDTGRQLIMPGEEDSISPEMRRRIWWSLFCLDTWASTTTGRPSLGRMGPSITVLKPGAAAQAVPTIPSLNSPQYIEQLKILPLIHAAVFCSIATKIQDQLAESPLLSPSETATHDAQILKWYEELPSILSSPEEPCPEFLQRVRRIMKWRFQNIRIVLHRPYLLTTALRQCIWSTLSAEEKVAVGKCRIVALKTIEEISQECMPDLISGWNAVWFCFQACMVPLVSLFSDGSQPDEGRKWKAAIETALQFFESVRGYSIAAKRIGEVVSKLYQAYKAYASSASQTPIPNPSLPQYQTQVPYLIETIAAAQMQLEAQVNLGSGQQVFQDNPASHAWANVNDPTILNNFWDGMMWDTNLPNMPETPFGLSNDYEYAGTAQYYGNAGACWMHGN